MSRGSAKFFDRRSKESLTTVAGLGERTRIAPVGLPSTG